DYYPDSKYHYSDINKGGFDVPYGNMTLGSVETIYKLKDKDPYNAKDANEAKRIKTAQHNWSLCCAIVTYSRSDIAAFAAILKRMVDEKVASNRNELAHGGPISQSIAQEIRDAIIGRKGKSGILCLLAERLEPRG